MTKHLVIWCLFCLSLLANAQSEFVYTLDTIALFSNDVLNLERKLKLSNGDLTYQLEQKTPIFIKNYGTGNLATLSYQGTSSTQNSLFWQGINLNPVNSGTTDYSLVDSYLFDSYTFKTSQNDLQGSGIGADLVLNSTYVSDSGLSLSHRLSYGSFNDFQFGTKINYKGNKNTFGMNFQLTKSKNDFGFYNPISKQYEERQNNEVRSFANRMYWSRVFENSYLQFESWNKFSQRQIPSPVHVVNQHETQGDQFSRNVLTYNRFLKCNFDWTQKLAYLYENYNYSNPSAKIEGHGEFSRVVYNSKLKKAFTHYYSSELNVFTEMTFAEISKLYKKRQLLGFSFVNKFKVSKRFSLNTTLRKEHYFNSISLPLVFDASFNYSTKHNKVYLRTNKNARIPTLNDWYWANGGNPNLKSEIAKTIYLGWNHSSRFNLNFESYMGQISQMIIWLPNSDNGLWQPQNLFSVERRGFNLELSKQLKFKNVKTLLGLIYSMTQSVEQQSKLQIIYTPVNQLKGWVEFELNNKLFVNYNIQWNDRRYVSRDHSSYLPGFTVSDISLYKKWSLTQKRTLTSSIEVKNVFGYSYYNIPFRPMPGRYFGLSLELNY